MVDLFIFYLVVGKPGSDHWPFAIRSHVLQAFT